MSEKKSTDPRFSRIYNDPKFNNVNKKGFKVKLDDRFSKKDLEIKRKTKVDKYGRKMRDMEDSKEAKDFDKYFEQEDEKEEHEKDKDEDTEVAVLDRARGEVPSDYVSSSDEFTSSDSEDSESEVESESESEVELEKSAPSAEQSSKTLAVVNLDWDNVRSSDLLIAFSSFLPAGGRIDKIAIYPSEFGKERMQREEVEGPPKELFKKKGKSKKSRDDDSDSDVDVRDLYEEGDADKSVDNKALRQYQLDRLRYYYAVVYCNNVAAAESIYNNCDGTEYESTANIFDLRYVPDGMDFNDEPKDSCTELPKNYKPLQFSTDALQHSNVKLTWDETPADRLDVAKRAFTQKEIEDMDFKAYLASDSDDSEAEAEAQSKDKLKSLVSSTSAFDLKKDDGGDDGEVDMEITFTPGLDEANKSAAQDGQEEESTIDKVRRKEKERRKARKAKVKELKQEAEKQKKEKLRGTKSNKQTDPEQESKSKAELELLMMDDEDDTEKSINKKAHFNMNEILKSEKEKKKKNKYQDKNKIVEDDFKPDLEDPRFKEMFEGHDFALDPTLPEFRNTKAMKEMLKKRSKHSPKGKSKKVKFSTRENSANGTGDIANIVAKLKKGGKKKAATK